MKRFAGILLAWALICAPILALAATPITTRAGKGAPLSYSEMDANLLNLRSRIDTDLELRLAAIEGAQNSSALGYITKAAMDADLAHVAGSMAVVTNDPTAANNTYWIKLGASGAGSWQKSAVSAFLPYYSSRQFTTLAQAITAIGSTNTAVLRVSTPLAVANGDTVPANISIIADNGGLLTGSGTEVAGFNGTFSAGLHQVFVGLGIPTGLKEARPEWWGGKGDTARYGYEVTSTYGTDNTVAVNKAISAVKYSSSGTGGVVKLSRGGYYFSGKIDAAATGLFCVTLEGEGDGTSLYGMIDGTFIDLTGPTFDADPTGDYSKLAVRFNLRHLRIYGDPAKAAGGNTVGFSAQAAAEVILDDVHFYYWNEGIFVRDVPGFSIKDVKVAKCGVGHHIVKTSTTVNSDIATQNFFNFMAYENSLDVLIDGGRDISYHGGLLASTPALKIIGSSNQVDRIAFFGTFFDRANTGNNILIGDTTDTKQILSVEFHSCYIAHAGADSSATIYINSPLVASILVNGGFTDGSLSPKFVELGPATNKSIRVDISGAGPANVLRYRIYDGRSNTVRTQIAPLNNLTELTHNSNLTMSVGNAPIDYQWVTLGSISRNTTDYITGSSLMLAANAVAPTLIFQPLFGDKPFEPGTELVVEWIAKTGGSFDPKNAVLFTQENIGGGSPVDVVADPAYTSLIQEFTNGYKRYISVFPVPANKIVSSVKCKGANNETLYVDYFAVYGPAKYKTKEAAWLTDYAIPPADAVYRGQYLLHRKTAADDIVYYCRKNAAGTYSWVAAY